MNSFSHQFIKIQDRHKWWQPKFKGIDNTSNLYRTKEPARSHFIQLFLCSNLWCLQNNLLHDVIQSTTRSSFENTKNKFVGDLNYWSWASRKIYCFHSSCFTNTSTVGIYGVDIFVSAHQEASGENAAWIYAIDRRVVNSAWSADIYFITAKR